MRFQWALATVAMVGLLATAVVFAEEQKAKDQKEEKDPFAGVVCPLSGKSVNPEQFVEYKKAKVFFCCANCPKAFAKAPEKHAEKANHQLAQTKQAKQEKCPFSGQELDKETKTKVVGVAVMFCCENCQAKVAELKDDQKKQLALVFNDKAFAKAYKIKDKEDKKEEKTTAKDT